MRERNHRGITAIEMVTVIGIIGILVTLSFPSLAAVKENVALGNTASELVNALRLAQNRSLASFNESHYGIDITANDYTPYHMTDPANPATKMSETKTALVSGINFVDASDPQCGAGAVVPDDIQFARLAGTLAGPHKLCVKYGSKIRIVIVETNGRVTLQ